VVYRLAGQDVLELWLALRRVAEERLAQVEQVVRDYVVPGAEGPLAGPEDVSTNGGVFLLLDVRPPLEYEAGHIPGAVSIPVDELPARLGSLPRDRRIIAYCRGRYCLFADEAVALLRQHGFDAVRLEGGLPEWRAEGRPVETGAG
jgi:rhodanese-related sulfurtransferase